MRSRSCAAPLLHRSAPIPSAAIPCSSAAATRSGSGFDSGRLAQHQRAQPLPPPRAHRLRLRVPGDGFLALDLVREVALDLVLLHGRGQVDAALAPLPVQLRRDDVRRTPRADRIPPARRRGRCAAGSAPASPAAAARCGPGTPAPAAARRRTDRRPRRGWPGGGATRATPPARAAARPRPPARARGGWRRGRAAPPAAAAGPRPAARRRGERRRARPAARPGRTPGRPAPARCPRSSMCASRGCSGSSAIRRPCAVTAPRARPARPAPPAARAPARTRRRAAGPATPAPRDRPRPTRPAPARAAPGPRPGSPACRAGPGPPARAPATSASTRPAPRAPRARTAAPPTRATPSPSPAASSPCAARSGARASARNPPPRARPRSSGSSPRWTSRARPCGGRAGWGRWPRPAPAAAGCRRAASRARPGGRSAVAQHLLHAADLPRAGEKDEHVALRRFHRLPDRSAPPPAPSAPRCGSADSARPRESCVPGW